MKDMEKLKKDFIELHDWSYKEAHEVLEQYMNSHEGKTPYSADGYKAGYDMGFHEAVNACFFAVFGGKASMELMMKRIDSNKEGRDA